MAKKTTWQKNTYWHTSNQHYTRQANRASWCYCLSRPKMNCTNSTLLYREQRFLTERLSENLCSNMILDSFRCGSSFSLSFHEETKVWTKTLVTQAPCKSFFFRFMLDCLLGFSWGFFLQYKARVAWLIMEGYSIGNMKSNILIGKSFACTIVWNLKWWLITYSGLTRGTYDVML